MRFIPHTRPTKQDRTTLMSSQKKTTEKTEKLLKREKIFLQVSKLDELSLVDLAIRIQHVAQLSQKLDDELEKRNKRGDIK